VVRLWQHGGSPASVQNQQWISKSSSASQRISSSFLAPALCCGITECSLMRTPSVVLIDACTTDVRCRVPVNTTSGSANDAAGPDYTGFLRYLRASHQSRGPSRSPRTTTAPEVKATDPRNGVFEPALTPTPQTR